VCGAWFIAVDAQVRAMDAVQEWSVAVLGERVEEFMVFGASKRGECAVVAALMAVLVAVVLTTKMAKLHLKPTLPSGWATWLTAAVDTRVIAGNRQLHMRARHTFPSSSQHSLSIVGTTHPSILHKTSNQLTRHSSGLPHLHSYPNNKPSRPTNESSYSSRAHRF
jgi:hypothetical protein